MSEKNRQEKELIERATLDYFLKAYNELKGTHLQFVNKRERPDFLVRNLGTNEHIGIEATTLFYDQQEAKFLLRRSNDTGGRRDFIEVAERLNTLLEKKSEQGQGYSFKGRLILVVRVVSRFFDREDFEEEEKDIFVPTNKFNEIWLILYDSSKQEYCDLKCLKP